MRSGVEAPCGWDAKDKEAWRWMVTHLFRDAIADRLADRFPTAQARRLKADELGDLAADLAVASRLLEAAAELETATARQTRPPARPLAPLAFDWAVHPIREGLEQADDLLVETSVATTLEDSARLIAARLEVDDMPDDLAFMERSGSGDARAELELRIERLRNAAFRAGQEQERVRFAEAVRLAKDLMPDHVPDQPPQRKRRWWKALAGLAKGGGMIGLNGSLLLAGAPIPLATPAVAVAVVGSFATGLEGLATGVGDMRGE
jgi:hypothetical protein